MKKKHKNEIDRKFISFNPYSIGEIGCSEESIYYIGFVFYYHFITRKPFKSILHLPFENIYQVSIIEFRLRPSPYLIIGKDKYKVHKEIYLHWDIRDEIET